MVPPGKCPKLYVPVPGCWKKCEQCLAFLQSDECFFAYVPRALTEESLGEK